MKLLIVGHARHGKDTVCNLLRDMYGFSFVSSSYFVAECAVRPALERQGLHYDSLDQCYADRVNHRAAWFDAIVAYNLGDPARLGRELFAKHDIYCGLRNRNEFDALKAEKAFDFAVWVDRSRHQPPEATTSMTITQDMTDYTVDNNDNMDHLMEQVKEVYSNAFIALQIGG